MATYLGVFNANAAVLSGMASYEQSLLDAAATLATWASSCEEGSARALFPSREPIVLVAIRPGRPGDSDGKADAVRLLALSGAVGKIVLVEGVYVGIMTLDAAEKLLDSVDRTEIEDDFSITRSFPFRDSKFVEGQLEMLMYWLDCPIADEVGGSALVFDFLVSKSFDKGFAPKYLHPAIEAIDEHDVEHETEWHKTLSSFLKHDSRAQRCGEELYLHRNAVLYRLKRMKEFTGINLDDPYERAYLRISLVPWRSGTAEQ